MYHYEDLPQMREQVKKLEKQRQEAWDMSRRVTNVRLKDRLSQRWAKLGTNIYDLKRDIRNIKLFEGEMEMN